MSFITVAVHCHNYQRRLCWMLSSLCQQTQPDLLVADVAYLAGNGAPCTENVLSLFEKRIRITRSQWHDYNPFQKRGITRNRQIKECKTEWLLFADCDMVYHPEYFERLHHELKTSHDKATYMISSGRFSTFKEDTNALVDSTITDTPIEVEHAFSKVEALPNIRKSNVGAGFSQIINLLHAPHAGYYVDAAENPDWGWTSRFHKTKSDIQFRHRIARQGGNRQKLPEWFTQHLIHLNHDRDKEVGYHLETQR